MTTETLPHKGLRIEADWPMIGLLITGYCLVKLTKQELKKQELNKK